MGSIPVDSIGFVGKPEGVGNVFLTYFEYFSGINTNLGVERHHGEVSIVKNVPR